MPFFQHLLKPNFDVVKRWVNEAQEAASSENVMVQVLHAIFHITIQCEFNKSIFTSFQKYLYIYNFYN